jgi:hypothetical protein
MVNEKGLLQKGNETTKLALKTTPPKVFVSRRTKFYAMQFGDIE